MGNVILKRKMSAQTLLLRLLTPCAHMFMCAHRDMLCNDKKVIKVMAMVSAPPAKTQSKNKHTRPSKWRRLIFVKLCYGAAPVPRDGDTVSLFPTHSLVTVDQLLAFSVIRKNLANC